MNSFHQGWHDRLWGIPVPQERKRLPQQVSYERGRHLAAMWQFYVRVQMREGTITSRGGVKCLTPEHALKWSYEMATMYMPDEFLLAIEHEARFCATLDQRLGLAAVA